MRKHLKILSVLLFVTILISQFSCSEAEFNRNRQVWHTSGVTNYRMTVELQKPGHATPNGKFIITVRGGKAEFIKRADNLEPVPETIRFGNYKTLDDIFQYIEDEEKRGGSWNKKEIEYDSKLGYPKRVNLDKDRVFDEEIFFHVLQFEVLE